MDALKPSRYVDGLVDMIKIVGSNRYHYLKHILKMLEKPVLKLYLYVAVVHSTKIAKKVVGKIPI